MQPTQAAQFPAAADPDAAARLIDDFAALGTREARFAAFPRGQAALTALGGNAPYLAALALREPDVMIGVLRSGAEPVLGAVMAELHRIAPAASRTDVAAGLRRAKRRAGLAIALADLAGFWTLEAVTNALSDLADAAVAVALRHLLWGLHDRGAIVLPEPARPESASRFAVLGMGKLGARELNYSSDIDLVLLFDPSCPVYSDEARNATARCDAQANPVREDIQSVMARLARDLVQLLAARDENGMVFRVDLRLRPDPAATPPVISLAAALAYYESNGRTWERAAFSKARPVAGDLGFGAAFLEQIRPFVWRRNLDFAAIGEIHDMKRRIDQRHGDSAGSVLGRDVKLGRGGIREIEFIVQTLELVWGGHEPALRIAPTLTALRALGRAKHLPQAAVRDLAASYRLLRAIEHRLQMVADRQTHALPDSEPGLTGLAIFLGEADRGEADATRFAGKLDRLFERVHAHFVAFFDAGAADAAGLDPGEAGRVPSSFRAEATAMGYADPQHLAERLRAWRGGSLPALRAARARALLDAILPALLAALARQPDPDLAFRRFDRMLERQRAGIPLLSLFQRNPALLGRLATVLGAAAALSEHLAVHPGALDALLAPVARFTSPAPVLRRLLGESDDLETTVNTLRRFVRREEFHLAVATLERRIDVDQAGVWRSDLAQAALAALLPRVLADVARRYGKIPGGRFAVVALGRTGAREMQPGSDLDLMLIYDHPPASPASKTRLPGSQYFGRLAQALVGAITAPGAEGPIYPVDMRLRPSGNKGPFAVSLTAFRRYHAEQAWTWERLALTRARVIAATRGFATTVDAAIADALQRHVDPATIRTDTVAMRRRIATETPASGPFDLKSRDGGMMELGFVVEALQLIHGPSNPALLHPSTSDALEALAAAGALSTEEAAGLIQADHWFRAVQAMRRITGLAAPEANSAPASLAPILAAAGVLDFAALIARLEQQAAIVRASFNRHLVHHKQGDTHMDLTEGDKSPAFSLPATGGRTASLADLKGRPFVLYFYPKADTPGCTKEACAFQEALPQLGHIGIEVIGVSKDKLPALEKFAAKYDLKFPLASDEAGSTVEAFGAWVEKSMYGKSYMGIDRSTFLIDKTGTIAQIWRKVKVPGHAKAVMDAAKALA